MKRNGRAVTKQRRKRCSTPHLVHAVQELQEDGREAAALAAGTQVAPLAKLVAKRQPLFLQQHLKTLQSSVERIAQQLHQRHHLQRGRDDQKKSENEISHSSGQSRMIDGKLNAHLQH